MSSQDTLTPVLGQILALIREKNLEAGDRLPSERDLSQRFDVSRSSVREALTTLEGMRLLERRRNAGIFLRDTRMAGSPEALVLFTDLGFGLDPMEINQSIEVRQLLELQAIGLACERRDDNDLTAMSDILEASESILEAGGNIAEQEEAFHMAIFAATGNSMLSRVVYPFYLMTRQLRQKYYQDAEHGRQSHAQHLEIFDAIQAHDLDKALSTMRGHLIRVDSVFRAGR